MMINYGQNGSESYMILRAENQAEGNQVDAIEKMLRSRGVAHWVDNNPELTKEIRIPIKFKE